MKAHELAKMLLAFPEHAEVVIDGLGFETKIHPTLSGNAKIDAREGAWAEDRLRYTDKHSEADIAIIEVSYDLDKAYRSLENLRDQRRSKEDPD